MNLHYKKIRELRLFSLKHKNLLSDLPVYPKNTENSQTYSKNFLKSSKIKQHFRQITVMFCRMCCQLLFRIRDTFFMYVLFDSTLHMENTRTEAQTFLKISSQNVENSSKNRKISSNHKVVPTTCFQYLLCFLTISFW